MGHRSQRFWLAAGAAGGRAPIFPGPGPAHAQGGQSPRALLEAPPSACAEKLRPQRSAEPVLGPVRPKESRAAGAREATCGIQPAPAALARGPTGGCRVTGSQIRVEGSVRFYQALDPRQRPVHVFWVLGTLGNLSVPMKSQILVRDLLYLRGLRSAGGFTGTHRCLPTSPPALPRAVLSGILCVGSRVP